MPDGHQRSCPHCGHVQATAAERCEHCGRSVLDRPARLSPAARRRALRAGALAFVAFAGGAAWWAADVTRDRDAREAALTRRAVAAERVRLTRLQAPHRGAARDLAPPRGASPAQRRAARAALVESVEARITADARRRAGARELEGPISHTECGPLLRAPDAVPDDRQLAKATGRYDCVAIKSDVKSSGSTVGKLGYPFVAALDFERFTYVWCRNTPAQGEGGKALLFVRLDRACLAARGRALGTGYVETPDE